MEPTDDEPTEESQLAAMLQAGPWAAHEFSMITLAHHTQQTERGAFKNSGSKACLWLQVDWHGPGRREVRETEPGWGASESERK